MAVSALHAKMRDIDTLVFRNGFVFLVKILINKHTSVWILMEVIFRNLGIGLYCLRAKLSKGYQQTSYVSKSSHSTPDKNASSVWLQPICLTSPQRPAHSASQPKYSTRLPMLVRKLLNSSQTSKTNPLKVRSFC